MMYPRSYLKLILSTILKSILKVTVIDLKQHELVHFRMLTCNVGSQLSIDGTKLYQVEKKLWKIPYENFVIFAINFKNSLAFTLYLSLSVQNSFICVLFLRFGRKEREYIIHIFATFNSFRTKIGLLIWRNLTEIGQILQLFAEYDEIDQKIQQIY